MSKEKKESTIRSADDLIVKTEAAKLGKAIPEVAKVEPNKAQEENKEVIEDKAKEQTAQKQKLDEPEAPEEEKAEQPKEQAEEEESQAQDASLDADSDNDSDGDVDEYGTKVAKKKLYTEEEVQRMIRDRLKRGQHSDQQQEVQQAAKDFKPDPESDESWEQQLEGFVEKTIQKLSKKQSDAEWQHKEQQNQAEFEVKFSEGMGKYKDFTKVVADKPITNAMMIATRTMNDPAAFLYAACKQHPKEIARISEIKDGIAQAAEIGRLEERMKKARAIPSSPKPATKISGDMSDEHPQVDIDARIAQHAKTKFART
jgi:hypothetical protein